MNVVALVGLFGLAVVGAKKLYDKGKEKLSDNLADLAEQKVKEAQAAAREELGDIEDSPGYKDGFTGENGDYNGPKADE